MLLHLILVVIDLLVGLPALWLGGLSLRGLGRPLGVARVPLGARSARSPRGPRPSP